MTQISDELYPRYYERTARSPKRQTSVAVATHRYAVRRAGAIPDAVGGTWQYWQVSMVYLSEQQLLDDDYQRVYPEREPFYDAN